MSETVTHESGSDILKRAQDLSLQHLQSFCYVYEARGYAAAARRTGLSVPTLWQHIQSLERVYGVKLFEKRGRQSRPTAAAAELFETMVPLLVGIESSFTVVNETQSGDDPAITIVAGARQMLEDLAAPLASFRRQFATRLVIRHGNNWQAEAMIRSGEADLAFALEPGYQHESPDVHYESVYSIDFLAVANRSHPFARQPRVGLRDLVKHALIVSTPGNHGRDALDQALHRERLRATVAVECDNSAFTIACARAGMGVGILAGRVDGQLCRHLAVRSLQRQLGKRQIVCMWRHGRQLTRNLRGLIESVKELGA